MRYVCLTALALFIGYLSRDWSRLPIWKKEVSFATMIAGVSEARNEIVFVTQYDHENKPIVGRTIIKRRNAKASETSNTPDEPIPAGQLTFLDMRANQPIVPKAIVVETCELSTGRVTNSVTVEADDLFDLAGLNERIVTLAHSSGGVLQIDRGTGAVATSGDFLVLRHCRQSAITGWMRETSLPPLALITSMT